MNEQELNKLLEWVLGTERLLENISDDLNDGTLKREYNQDDLVFNIQSKIELVDSIKTNIKIK